MGRDADGFRASRTRYSQRSPRRCRAAAHLRPCATERVVGQELHDVARREELVAHRQLTAVARRLALVAHLLALVAAVEELVDPADGLVLAPDAVELRRVEYFESASNVCRRGQSDGRGIAAVEQDLHLSRELIEEALDVEAVTGSVREQGHAWRHPAELAVADGLIALA